MKSKSSKQLLSALKSKSAKIRNEAAIEIMDKKIKGGKEALLEAALNHKNLGYTGTLLYALEAFDCSDLFSVFIDMALFGTYEVRWTSLMALKNKKFKPTKKEIALAEYKIAALKNKDIVIEDKAKLIYSLNYVVQRIKKNAV